MSVGAILSTEHKNIQNGELSVLHFVSAIIEMIFSFLLIKLIPIFRFIKTKIRNNDIYQLKLQLIL